MIEAYFMTDGRLRRMPYFGYSILLLPILLLLGGLCLAAMASGRFPALLSLGLASLIAMFGGRAVFALGIKRCHDFERSAWFYFWVVWAPALISTTVSLRYGSLHFEFAVPIIRGIAGIVSLIGNLYVLFKRGTDGPNRYGYPP